MSNQRDHSNKPMNDKSRTGNDPLHGVTLKMIVTELHQKLGWRGLGEQININCFKSNPSIKSSLTFLRKTPWAREKVEKLYVDVVVNNQKQQSSAKKPLTNPWLKTKS